MEMMVRLIVVLPLISAILVGFFHRQIGDKNSRYLATGVLIACAIMSWIVFFPKTLRYSQTQYALSKHPTLFLNTVRSSQIPYALPKHS